MAPDYKCECDLGWSGVDCSVDCGCYNHSSCSKGVGLCDSCQEFTTGQFCEICEYVCLKPSRINLRIFFLDAVVTATRQRRLDASTAIVTVMGMKIWGFVIR